MILLFLRKIFIILASSCFLFIFFYGFFQFSKIDTVKLQVDPSLKVFLKNKNIQKQMEKHLNLYKGKSIWKVNLKDVSESLKKISPSHSIYVVRRLPNHLIVFLERENPVAIILKNERDFFFVSYTGDIKFKLTEDHSLDFPILRGSLFWQDKTRRKQMIDLLLSLPKKDLFTSKNISEIKYNKKNTSFILYLISGHFILEWGGKFNLKKIQNINFVLKYLSEEGHSNYHIDARLDKKIIVNKVK